MHHFQPRDGALHAEDVSIEAIAAEVGTPVYVYSTATLTRHYDRLRAALDAHIDALGGPLIAFAVKANSNLSVLVTLAARGCGADTVSEGEMRRALAAGIPADRIILSGVGKTNAELRFALSVGIRQINVESAQELDRLIAVAESMGAVAPVAIRVNPNVGAGGHAKITTGGARDKFGVPVAEALDLYARGSASAALNMVGLACHIGSQILDLKPLEDAFEVLAGMTRTLRSQGLSVTRLDLGGGLGVPYHGHTETPSIEDYVAAAARVLDGLEVEAAFEPGRLLAANAGVLVAQVIQVTERSDGGRFLVLDAGMNDLMRPALYDAFHEIVAVRPRDGDPVAYDVVGPVCESTDVFTRGRALPPLQAGDLIAFQSAGAYGAVMAGDYNSRPLVAEALVDGSRWAVVRARQTYDEMLGRDVRADWL